MAPWLAECVDALEDYVQEGTPYNEYISWSWYTPQTHTRLVHVVDPPPAHVPAPIDAYPVHLARNMHLAVRTLVFQNA